MSSTPVLAIPHFVTPFIIETDASDGGIGAVLMQKDQPMAFMSKAWDPIIKNYPSMKRSF
jgi:hypothetical protein